MSANGEPRGTIRVGIGGWTFAPWRGPFYPAGLPQAQELAHASRRLTAIEINGTFYRTQSPASFAKWAAETPDDFVFAMKGHRVVTHSTDLAVVKNALDRFMASGIDQLGDKQGPILWQFPPTRRFDPESFSAFLALLPREQGGRPVRHAVEVFHPSFRDERFVDLLREHGVALALVDSDKALGAADLTADFVYARLKRGADEEPTCYRPADIDAWTTAFRRLASGEPPDLPQIGPAHSDGRPRDCFVFFIQGGKVRAPAGAEAMIARLAPETEG